MRQCPDHYTIRAGRNLPDKEFRYLRTVIVTAAVHWGFDSMLAHLLLTFQHWAGVSSYTSSFDLAETCVFAKQLPGPIHCGSPFGERPLFRSYGTNLPSSLTTLLPLALEFSSCLPVSVCGTGVEDIHHAFLAFVQAHFANYSFVSLTTGSTNARLVPFQSVPWVKSFDGNGMSTVCASTTPFGLALAPDYLEADEPSFKNLRLSAIMILT